MVDVVITRTSSDSDLGEGRETSGASQVGGLFRGSETLSFSEAMRMVLGPHILFD